MRYKNTEEELRQAVLTSLSIRQVLDKLDIIAAGGNYKTIHSRIKQYEIDTSHFTGAAWNVGENFKPFGKKIKLNDILVENSTYSNTFTLKNRLFAKGIKSKICEICKKTHWLEKPIALELHHINGVNNDNRIENLMILCPNCHAQTDNYRGKNQKRINKG